jgi:membrane-associated phospholipid phosphatase
VESIQSRGIAVILFLQGLGEWLTAPMKFLSFLGLPEFYLLFMPAVYWCVDVSLAVRLGLILLPGVALSNAFKILLHQPRPYWITQHVRALDSYGEFGLPSGHAQNAVTDWGLLAASLRRRWAWAAALGLMFLIGLSRVYLAVHFPSDVIVGWLVGALLLWAFLRWEKPVGDWLRHRSARQLVLLSLLVSLGLLGLTGLAIASLGDWQWPASWHENAVAGTGEAPDPLAPFDTFTATGALFGLAAGLVWMSRAGGFRPEGPTGKRVVRFLVGIVGVAILWYGLGEVFTRASNWLGYSLRYLRYALVGLWTSAGAPMLFLRLNLADKRDESAQ